MALSMEDCLSIGQVLRPQGLKGQVKVRPDTDNPERFRALGRVFLNAGGKHFKEIAISGVSVRGGFVYLNLGEDSTVEAAEARRDLLLYIPRQEAVPLGEHENFITDIIGCELFDTLGKRIGLVKDVLQPGANDVYVVETPEGTLLVPALRHVVLSVDTASKKMLADPVTLWEVSVLED